MQRRDSDEEEEEEEGTSLVMTLRRYLRATS